MGKIETFYHLDSALSCCVVAKKMHDISEYTANDICKALMLPLKVGLEERWPKT